MKKVVAIDGPSGSGKTTIARLIAEKIGFNYLDTGALYRAVALALRAHRIEPEDNDDTLKNVLDSINVRFANGKVLLDGRDVSEKIRSREIDHYSSVFSARKIVRDFLLEAQRNAALENDLVVEGRDTTTVIFPDALKKIFLDASLEERARRRYLQFKIKGINIDMEEARKSITERDKRDSYRDIAPLKKAPDAFVIDSSDLPVEKVKDRIMEFIEIDP
jgi:CMP/dCMP kinase